MVGASELAALDITFLGGGGYLRNSYRLALESNNFPMVYNPEICCPSRFLRWVIGRRFNLRNLKKSLSPSKRDCLYHYGEQVTQLTLSEIGEASPLLHLDDRATYLVMLVPTLMVASSEGSNLMADFEGIGSMECKSQGGSKIATPKTDVAPSTVGAATQHAKSALGLSRNENVSNICSSTRGMASSPSNAYQFTSASQVCSNAQKSQIESPVMPADEIFRLAGWSTPAPVDNDARTVIESPFLSEGIRPHATTPIQAPTLSSPSVASDIFENYHLVSKSATQLQNQFKKDIADEIMSSKMSLDMGDKKSNCNSNRHKSYSEVNLHPNTRSQIMTSVHPPLYNFAKETIPSSFEEIYEISNQNRKKNKTKRKAPDDHASPFEVADDGFHRLGDPFGGSFNGKSESQLGDYDCGEEKSQSRDPNNILQTPNDSDMDAMDFDESIYFSYLIEEQSDQAIGSSLDNAVSTRRNLMLFMCTWVDTFM